MRKKSIKKKSMRKKSIKNKQDSGLCSWITNLFIGNNTVVPNSEKYSEPAESLRLHRNDVGESEESEESEFSIKSPSLYSNSVSNYSNSRSVPENISSSPISSSPNQNEI